jgi:hypothetical protein
LKKPLKKKKTQPSCLEHRVKEGLGFYEAPVLCGRGGLTHAFMTREGGFSTGEFSGLNLGMGSGDDPLKIHANMERLSRAFGLLRGVATVRQVHGKGVVIMDDSPEVRPETTPEVAPEATQEKREETDSLPPEADAIITSTPGLAVGILTADCVPLLLSDPVAGLVAAVHAGWRGFVAGVIEMTLGVMASTFGTRSKDVLVAIGPHIGPCCYEVSDDLEEEFRKNGIETERVFREESGSLHLDLGAAVSGALLGLGIEAEHMSGPGPCTACDEAHFFSYRRDGRTGRQLSFVMMK